MSTIFADKFKNTSGGNPVQINQLRGIDTAGSITVQGEGTATTNLQQGLAKSWVIAAGDGSGINDSINITSQTDTAAGITFFTFTNNKVEAWPDFVSFCQQWLSFPRSCPGHPGGVKWRCHAYDPWPQGL